MRGVKMTAGQHSENRMKRGMRGGKTADGQRGPGAAMKEQDVREMNARTDYRTYQFTRREYAQLILLYLAGASAVAWLFYRSFAALFPAAPAFPFFLRKMRDIRAAARRKQLSYDFRTALHSLTVSLRAGRSVENAFPDAARDLVNTIGEKQDMTQEFIWISRQIRLSVPMEEALWDFAARSGVEDIENFAAVFTTAKRMGGNMAAILKSAADSIGGKIDVEREIETALAAKKMEQKIMTAMPCMIILYMTFASPGFLDDMYGSAFGVLIMTGCLLVYAAAIWWSSRIVAIEV